MGRSKKSLLIEEAKEKLQFIPNSRIEFNKNNNQGIFWLWEERKKHNLLSLEWIKHDNVDYIQLESTNETMKLNPNDVDKDDLSDFDTDEVEKILRMAKLI